MKKDTYSSVFRIVKLHTDQEIAAAGHHNLRERPPANADQARSVFNRVIVGEGHSPLELVKNRISDLEIKVLADNVRAIECIISAGKPFFSKASLRDWVNDSLAFVERKFGKGCIVHVTLHMDEGTPHLHPILVPVLAANDTDGKSYKNHKQRKWKLASTEILHSMAHLRTIGQRRINNSLFVADDITDIKKLAKRLFTHPDPPSRFVWKSLTPTTQDALKACALFTRKNKAALVALLPELNRIIQGESIDAPNRFLGVPPSPEVTQFRVTDKNVKNPIRLNRLLLEDAFAEVISTRRAIGKESAPFLHSCQEDYFNLCKKYDPEISAPKYKTKLTHQELTEWNGVLVEAVAKNTSNLTPEFKPPGYGDRLAPERYISGQIESVKAQVEHSMELVTVKAAAYEITKQENERLQAGIRVANLDHEKEVNALKSRVAELENQNKDLMAKLRVIPLAAVAEKLGYSVQLMEGKTLVQLPDDRVLDIAGNRFVEATAFGGKGTMKGRRKGGGAIDFLIWVTGWDLDTARRWLSKHFAVNEVLATDAERTAQELAPKLEVPQTQAEVDHYWTHEHPTFLPADHKWPLVRQWLIQEHAFAPEFVDKVRAENKVWANVFGGVVFPIHVKGQFAGAVVTGTHPNPQTGTIFRHEIGSPAIGYSLGSPDSQVHALVDSPLEALSYSELFPAALVTSTNGNITPEFLETITTQAAESKAAVILAFERTPDGKRNAKAAEAALDHAGVKNLRQEPPEFHENATSWRDLMAASKGHLSRFTDITLEKARDFLQIATDWFKRTVENLKPRGPQTKN